MILTLPEYRLSFQLKMYESIQKGTGNSRQFINVHNWINENVRSILDESDAILHAKSQLVYTVGNQLPLDGGVDRWSVAQAVLKRIPFHMKSLYKKLGEEKIEFDQEYLRNRGIFGGSKVNYRSDIFTPCRLIDESAYDELKKLLVEDFVHGRMDIIFPETEYQTQSDLRTFLCQRKVDSQIFNKIKTDFTPSHLNVLMILSGLLRFEVLKLVFMKRWRVNYGVNEQGSCEMAIPFKAKDVAVEKTEFGHPDVAICLTQLSYYYSGKSL